MDTFFHEKKQDKDWESAKDRNGDPNNNKNSSQNNNQNSRSSKKYIAYIITAVAIWFSFKYLLPLFLPLVLAALVVIPSASVIHKINNRLHIGKGILTGGILIVIVFLLLLVLWTVLVWLIGNVSAIFQNGDTLWEQVANMLFDACEVIERQTGMQQGTLETILKNKGISLLSSLQNSLLPTVMMSSVKSVQWIFSVVVTLLITSLAAVLLAKDYEALKEKIMKRQDMSAAAGIVHKMGGMLIGYVKAQGIIYMAVAGICLAGFYFAELEHPLQTALITAFLDVLPFIGTGIVLGPMAIWYLINEKYWKVLICGGIYLLCLVTRQLLEPRLIGKNTGIFPIIILISIYTGIKLYGLGGVILGPLSFLLYQEIITTIDQTQ